MQRSVCYKKAAACYTFGCQLEAIGAVHMAGALYLRDELPGSQAEQFPLPRFLFFFLRLPLLCIINSTLNNSQQFLSNKYFSFFATRTYKQSTAPRQRYYLGWVFFIFSKQESWSSFSLFPQCILQILHRRDAQPAFSAKFHES